MPTLVYSEDNCILNHSQNLSTFGKKAMIVTGKNSSRINGSLSDLIEALEKENINYIVFDDIEENPSVETVMKAREIGINEHVDFIIGLGGGSPLDASKAISLMIYNKDLDESVLYESKTLSYLPVVCIPTTCGTGSEVTPYSILTLHKKRTKQSISHKIYPALALIDGKYLKTTKREYLISTLSDALSHLIESFLNTNSNLYNRVYSRAGLKLWGEIKEKLLNDSFAETDYNLLMDISMIAGIAIAHTGTALPHGLSYHLTYEYNIPHGRAVALYLPGYTKIYKDKKDSMEVINLLGFKDYEEFDIFMKTLLKPLDLPISVHETNADLLLSNPSKLKNYPFEVSREELINLIN
jgi:alcohol dehydrogenase